MNDIDQKRYLPGCRGIFRDIEEAGGPLCRIDEIVADHGIERLLEAVDIGMVIYQAGDVLFASAGDFRIYNEMLDRIEAGDEGGEEVAPMEAAE